MCNYYISVNDEMDEVFMVSRRREEDAACYVERIVECVTVERRLERGILGLLC